MAHTTIKFEHIPVLLPELLTGMAFMGNQTIVDATVGGGGHLIEVIHATQSKSAYIAIDRDPHAVSFVTERFTALVNDGILKIKNKRFSELHQILVEDGLMGSVDRIYADIGVSSVQLDVAERGFSFLRSGPLDMRMNQSAGITAADVINSSPPGELASIFKEFGEEPRSSYFVNKIVARRDKAPFLTTGDLASYIAEVSPYSHSRKHPATRIFQALRIHVNGELSELTTFLRQSFDALKVGGRLGIITFHSLEDRIVKSYFQELSAVSLPKGLPVTAQQITAMGLGSWGKIVKPFPGEPSEEEVEFNPRSRSAKLRIIEKIKGGF